jgi:hypothetical protein
MGRMFLKQNKIAISKFTKLLQDRVNGYYRIVPNMGLKLLRIYTSIPILGVDFKIDIILYVSPNIIVSGYDKYIVFALDLRNPNIQVIEEDSSSYFYLFQIFRKGDYKKFEKLSELQSILSVSSTSLPKITTTMERDFENSSLYKNDIIPKLNEYENSIKVTLSLDSKAFPFVTDRDILPICVFSETDEDLTGYGYNTSEPDTWKKGRVSLTLTDVKKRDFREIRLPVAMVCADVNGVTLITRY